MLLLVCLILMNHVPFFDAYENQTAYVITVWVMELMFLSANMMVAIANGIMTIIQIVVLVPFPI